MTPTAPAGMSGIDGEPAQLSTVGEAPPPVTLVGAGDAEPAVYTTPTGSVIERPRMVRAVLAPLLTSCTVTGVLVP
ncbi:MAG TPA: hypothetical protein VFS60_14810, partial [Thermoanaerobaculia bacterium]|nr:hypothetical protein [Thermoanaerobaculia bacterium]